MNRDDENDPGFVAMVEILRRWSETGRASEREDETEQAA
jgi:hypothetical protein